MDNELVEEVLRRIDELGSSLSDGATHGFEILVRQQIISGVASIFWSSLLLALALTIARKLIPSAREHAEKIREYEQDRGYRRVTWEDWIMPHLAWLILGPIAGIIGSVMITIGIQQLLNPGYYAIADILRAVN